MESWEECRSERLLYRTKRVFGRDGCLPETSSSTAPLYEIKDEEFPGSSATDRPFDECAQDTVNEPRREVTAWRLAYLQFRQGASYGARGEPQDLPLTRDAVCHLPVCQILAQRRLWRGKGKAARGRARGGHTHTHTPKHTPTHSEAPLISHLQSFDDIDHSQFRTAAHKTSDAEAQTDGDTDGDTDDSGWTYTDGDTDGGETEAETEADTEIGDIEWKGNIDIECKGHFAEDNGDKTKIDKAEINEAKAIGEVEPAGIKAENEAEVRAEMEAEGGAEKDADEGDVETAPASVKRGKGARKNRELQDDGETGLHLHFGCGKIGLGLLLGTFMGGDDYDGRSARTILLANSESEGWPSTCGSRLTVELSSGQSYEVDVLRPLHSCDANSCDVNSCDVNSCDVNSSSGDGDVGEEMRMQTQAKMQTKMQAKMQTTLKEVRGPVAIVLLPTRHLFKAPRCECGCETLMKPLVESASSYSCAVGTQGLEFVFRCLNHFGQQNSGFVKPKKILKKTLFCCENDHATVSKLTESFALENVHVSPCMIDRICSAITVAEPSKILVTVEPFGGEIVVTNPPPPPRRRASRRPSKHSSTNPPVRVPFVGNGLTRVLVPQMDCEAEFYATRKFLFVNGGHTVLAFLSMIRERARGVAFTPPGDMPLLSYDELTDREKITYWAFAAARLLLLAYENEPQISATETPTPTTTGRASSGVGEQTPKVSVAELIDYVKVCTQRFSTLKDTTRRILSGGVTTRFDGRIEPVRTFLSSMPLRRSRNSSTLAGAILSALDVDFCDVVMEVSVFIEQCRVFTKHKVKRCGSGFTIPKLQRKSTLHGV